MAGCVRVYQAKRYLGGFAIQRKLVWVADAEGCDGQTREVLVSACKCSAIDSATSEAAFTGFPLIVHGRMPIKDATIRELA